jgi:hypothetical protein
MEPLTPLLPLRGMKAKQIPPAPFVEGGVKPLWAEPLSRGSHWQRLDCAEITLLPLRGTRSKDAYHGYQIKLLLSGSSVTLALAPRLVAL